MKTIKLFVLLLLAINVSVKSQSGGASGTNYVISGASSGSTYGGKVTAGGAITTPYPVGGDVTIAAGNGGSSAGNIILNAGTTTGSAQNGKITLNAPYNNGGGIYLNGITNVNNTLTVSGTVTGGSFTTTGAVSSGSITASGMLTANGGFTTSQTISVGGLTTSGSLTGGSLGSSGTNNLLFKTNGTTRVTILGSNGNIGIGVTSPTSALHIKSTDKTPFVIEHSSSSDYSYASLIKTNKDYAKAWALIDNSTGTEVETFLVFGKGDMYVAGNVAVGCSSTYGYKLAVAGSMIAEKVIVKLKGDWADYVFSENYKRRTLAETEAYIKANKHLPDVPSATEVKEKGIDVGEMNTILLKKIEEMTLLLIEQEKKMEQMSSELEKLKGQK